MRGGLFHCPDPLISCAGDGCVLYWSRTIAERAVVSTEAKARGKFSLRNVLSCETVPFSTMLALFLPLLLENICTQGFGLLNTSMVSSSGMTVLSGVSLVESVSTLFVMLFQGFASGASILVAQYLGAHREKEMRDVASLAVTVTAVLSAVVSLAVILLRYPLLHLCFRSAEPEVIDIAAYYLFGGTVSLPLCAVWMAELGVLRGAGESRIALISVVANSVVYLAFNYLFLVVMDLSVLGLIWSLALSRAAGLISCMAAKRILRSRLCRSPRELFRPVLSYLRPVIFYGFPISFENLIMKAARIVLLAIVTPLGTNAIASYNIAYNITVFSQIPSVAVMNTIFVAAGMCMGAGRPEELQKLYKGVAWLNRALYLLVNGSILLLSGPVLAAFHPEPEMLPELHRCLWLVLGSEILYHTESFTVVYLLRGCGDVTFPAAVSVITLCLFRLGASWVFAHPLGLGVFGLFLGLCSDWLVRAVIFQSRYLRGRWKTLHVISS